LGNGDGTFKTVSQPNVAPGPVADFNGDGVPDLAVNTGLQSYVILGNGDGTFGGPTVLGTPGKYNFGFSLGPAADFNSDGRTDLAAVVTLGTSPDGIGILLNTTTPASTVSFSPGTVAFASQTLNTSSAQVPVIVKNTGKNPLTVTSVTLAGTNASEFSQTNNCTTVQPGNTCTIEVVFSPTVSGGASGLLNIADNAFSGSQSVSLSGTGTAAPSFTLGAASGGSTSATISAGQTATFNLALTPTGSFSGTVSLTCAVTPAATAAPLCTVPGSVTVAGGSATSVTVSVSTTAAGSSGGPAISYPSGLGPLGWTVVAAAFSFLFFVNRRRLVRTLPAFVLVAAMAGCGSSSSTSTGGGAKGTPAATYSASVTATSGSVSQQTTLKVVVQ